MRRGSHSGAIRSTPWMTLWPFMKKLILPIQSNGSPLCLTPPYRSCVPAVTPHFLLFWGDISCTCGHAGCLIWHGSYRRKVIFEDSVLSLRIARVRCRNCGCTHAVLLSSIVPYSQIPLTIHVSVARCCENGGSLCSVLSGQPHLDENHISSLARSYRRHWRERLRAVSACAASLRELVRTCFTAFSRQFMQIKTTRNKLFLLPT